MTPRHRDPLDNGAADVLVLLADQGTLDTDSLVLPGGGSADVFADDDGDTLVQVGAGRVTSGEVVRAVVRSPAFTARAQVLDLVVMCEGGYDRYVLSPDRDHRLLFTRQWADREQTGAPVVAVVGRSPAELDPPAPTAGDGGLLAAVLDVAPAELGAPARLHVITLLTSPAARGAELTWERQDRKGPRVRAEAMADADVIVPAWGVVPEAGLWAVDAAVEELRGARDEGARILLRARDGAVEAVGHPPQPSAHPVNRPGTRLVDAPADWLWGAPLV